MSPLMSPKKCDEEAGPDLMTKIRSAKTDSKNISESTKIFQWLSSPNPKTSSSLDFQASFTEVVRSSDVSTDGYSLAHELEEFFKANLSWFYRVT